MNSINLFIGNSFTDQEKQDYFVFLFIAMVIEDCKIKWNKSGSNVYELLKAGGVIEYLTNGYDCLHTQSMEYIINDIEEILLKVREETGGLNEI